MIYQEKEKGFLRLYTGLTKQEGVNLYLLATILESSTVAESLTGTDERKVEGLSPNYTGTESWKHKL